MLDTLTNATKQDNALVMGFRFNVRNVKELERLNE